MRSLERYRIRASASKNDFAFADTNYIAFKMVRFTSLLNAFCCVLVAQAVTAKNFDDWDHGRVALEDVSIHFRYAGSGPPLLLVHGNPQFSLTWQFIGPILAEQFTVIAPDNRVVALRTVSDVAICTLTRSSSLALTCQKWYQAAAAGES